MPGEDWLAVPDWPGYQVSSRGRVRSVDRVLSDGRGAGGKLLKTVRGADGYRHVTLSDGGRRRQAHVARLVLEAFSGPCPEGMEALHGNGRRWDNRLANLRWGTKPENRADRERHRVRTTVSAASEGTGVTEEAGETGGAAPCPFKVVSSKEGTRR